MAKIAVQALLTLFERMAREDWTYTWGAAREGEVDCSGAFVYAYAQLGGAYIEHGSNAIARRRVGSMLPISAARPGYAAFKAREPGESGYDLPAKYREGGSAYTGDLRDYYHIGLVSRDGLHVLNAQGTQRDFETDRIDTFDFCAPLTAVDYDGEEIDMDAKWQGTVTTRSGPLNLREGPDVSEDIVTQILRGETVDVLWDEARSGWLWVSWRGVSGYVSAQYIQRTDEAQESAPESTGGAQTGAEDADEVTLTLSREAAEMLWHALGRAIS